MVFDLIISVSGMFCFIEVNIREVKSIKLMLN
ncbi:Uncharacterised protein [Serratia quinivorans]|nr:Uncharacterised protein [Serratia quinivorans]